MNVKDNRYRKLYVSLECFQDQSHEFFATSNLVLLASNLETDERVMNDIRIDEFYQESMEKIIRPSLENVSGVFLALQDSELHVSSISNADVAWIAETLTKISNLQCKIQSCVDVISAHALNRKTPPYCKDKMETLKYHINNLSTFVTMIIKRLAEFLTIYQQK